MINYKLYKNVLNFRNNCSIDKLNEPYAKIINIILCSLVFNNEETENYHIREIIINHDNYSYNKKDNNIEKLRNLISTITNRFLIILFSSDNHTFLKISKILILAKIIA